MHKQKRRKAVKAFNAEYKPLAEMYRDEFDANDSEIETVARDCIGQSVGYILEWFDIPIDVEDAIRERDW